MQEAESQGRGDKKWEEGLGSATDRVRRRLMPRKLQGLCLQHDTEFVSNFIICYTDLTNIFIMNYYTISMFYKN